MLSHVCAYTAVVEAIDAEKRAVDFPTSSPRKPVQPSDADALKTRLRAILLLVLLACLIVSTGQAQTIVERYGQLRVSGNRILDKNGTAVQLRGMSLYWSQWIPKYYNYNTIKWLRDDWKVTVVRAAMAVDVGGYATNPTAEQNKVFTVIDAAISLGIYVIVDFHVHEAQNYRSQALTFYRAVAQRYGNSPNVLYEPWNEPLTTDWTGIIKPYHEAVISAIRQYDPDNIIICGTGFYSQDVDIATSNPINQSNIAYTLHYYADTHKQGLRDKAQTALNRNRAIFVTEYGTTAASGDGYVNEAETRTWWTFLDNNKVSHANWSVADIAESSAALQSGASVDGGWPVSQIKQSGQLVRNELRAKDPLASSGTTLGTGKYRITVRHSGKVLDVAGASTADGADVTQYSSYNTTNQQWTVTALGNSQYSIRAVHSGKSLDVYNNSTADGADINQWSYSGNNNQRWRVESVGSGYYRIVSVNSGKCIDIPGSSTADGTSINQWGCNGGTNQQFQFSYLGSAREGSSELVSLEERAQVYPNPSAGTFTVRQGGAFSYDVLDSSGKALQSGKGVDQATVGSSLTPGFYLLRVQAAGKPQVLKMIKQ